MGAARETEIENRWPFGRRSVFPVIDIVLFASRRALMTFVLADFLASRFHIVMNDNGLTVHRRSGEAYTRAGDDDE